MLARRTAMTATTSFNTALAPESLALRKMVFAGIAFGGGYVEPSG
jgi:hypothetical protein